jgi:ABC-type uncharacterized transport system substrate-binding protein
MNREQKWMITCYTLIIGAIASWIFSAPPHIFWLLNISAFVIAVTGYIKQIRGTW